MDRIFFEKYHFMYIREFLLLRRAPSTQGLFGLVCYTRPNSFHYELNLESIHYRSVVHTEAGAAAGRGCIHTTVSYTHTEQTTNTERERLQPIYRSTAHMPITSVLCAQEAEEQYNTSLSS